MHIWPIISAFRFIKCDFALQDSRVKSVYALERQAQAETEFSDEDWQTKLEIDKKSGNSTGIVTICEGKYHQVKKMFTVCGLKVVHLQRISVGNLYLDGNLPIGSAKKLTKLEIEAIFVGKIH